MAGGSPRVRTSAGGAEDGHLVAAGRSDRALGGRTVEMHLERVDRQGVREHGQRSMS
jgi:hypothetical protein